MAFFSENGDRKAPAGIRRLLLTLVTHGQKAACGDDGDGLPAGAFAVAALVSRVVMEDNRGWQNKRGKP